MGSRRDITALLLRFVHSQNGVESRCNGRARRFRVAAPGCLLHPASTTAQSARSGAHQAGHNPHMLLLPLSVGLVLICRGPARRDGHHAD